MDAAVEFISHYSLDSHLKIAFAWNGKHDGDFRDSNQEFRRQIISVCISRPENVSTLLIEHLFLEEAA